MAAIALYGLLLKPVDDLARPRIRRGLATADTGSRRLQSVGFIGVTALMSAFFALELFQALVTLHWIPASWGNDNAANLLVMAGVAIPSCFRAWRREQVIQRLLDWHLRGFCPVCGYDLRESPHRCPECGTVPDDLGYADPV